MEFKPGDYVAFVNSGFNTNCLAMHETPFGQVFGLSAGKSAMKVDSVPFVKSVYKYSGFTLVNGVEINERVVRRYEIARDHPGADIIQPLSHPIKCWLSRSKQSPGWRARFDYEDGDGEFEVDIVPYNPDEIYT